MAELPKGSNLVIGWVVVLSFLAIVVAATVWLVHVFLVGC
jgi:hypothetical protein